MNILKIIPDTIVDGSGLRTSIYFAGCKIHCKGCHNPESWSLDNGKQYTVDEIIEIVESYKNNKITLTGGNPLDQKDLNQLLTLCIKLKENKYNIWFYSGYTWDQILNNELYTQIITNVDVVVDGPFIEELKNLKLKFRGSSNQRIINVSKSLENNQVILL